MSYVFEPEAQVAVPVVGSASLFPVRRIYCVGRNYAAHAREMGFDPDRDPPFFFCKPDNAVVPVKGAIWVRVDGKDRRRNDIANLIWSVPEIVADLSKYFEGGAQAATSCTRFLCRGSREAQWSN